MKKKFLVILLCLSILCSGIVSWLVSNADTDMIYIGPADVSKKAGETFVANVDFDCSQKVIAAQATISYPSDKIEYVSVQKGTYCDTCQNNPNGTISVIYMNGDEAVTGDVICYITFKVKDSVTAGTKITIEYTFAEATTEGFSTITLTKANKQTVTVASPATPSPTPAPTATPTATPTKAPTATPTKAPTATPTKAPTATPTKAPTATPTTKPTATPTSKPTATPTPVPTATPNKNVNITKLTIEHSSIKIYDDEYMDASYSILPSNATEKVTWTSDDTKIATVTDKGGFVRITGVSNGKTIVRGTAPSGKTVTCSVEIVSRATPAPTKVPTPTPTATVEPTATLAPSPSPTPTATNEPSVTPTVEPTATPFAEPTNSPTTEPTFEPTTEPTVVPSSEPTDRPTSDPTANPTETPVIDVTSTPELTSTPTPGTTPVPIDHDNDNGNTILLFITLSILFFLLGILFGLLIGKKIWCKSKPYGNLLIEEEKEKE